MSGIGRTVFITLNTDLCFLSLAAEVTAVSLALKCLKSWRQLPLHVYIIIPIVYIVIRVIIPYMLEKGKVKGVPMVLLAALLAQFLPKGYHALYHFDEARNHSLFVFGTLTWQLTSKLFRYLLFSHAAGTIWFLFAMKREADAFWNNVAKRKNATFPSWSVPQPMTMAIRLAPEQFNGSITNNMHNQFG